MNTDISQNDLEVIEAMEGRLGKIKLPENPCCETWRHMKDMAPVDMALSVILDDLVEKGWEGDVIAQVHACHENPADLEAHDKNWTHLCTCQENKIGKIAAHLGALAQQAGRVRLRV